MIKRQLSTLTKSVLIAGFSFALSVAPSFAAIITFSVSQGIQPSNVGTITLTDNGSNSVKVDVALLSAQYGFLNTGGPHTPFAFNLNGVSGLNVIFTTPSAGFSLNTAGGDNTPFGSFGVALDKSGGNGSGNAHYGNLVFTLTGTGLSTNSFAPNAEGYYFSADLTNGQNTGAQAWKIVGGNIPGTPDGGTTAALLGLTLAGLALARRLGMNS